LSQISVSTIVSVVVLLLPEAMMPKQMSSFRGHGERMPESWYQGNDCVVGGEGCILPVAAIIMMHHHGRGGEEARSVSARNERLKQRDSDT
jgi:hypothetical protein